MITLTIELPATVYERLQATATGQGKPIEIVAQEWLIERSNPERSDLLPPAPSGEREQAIAALRAAGLLTELSPDEKARAARVTLTLEQARTMLDRAGGKPLSEVVIDMRGPKV